MSTPQIPDFFVELAARAAYERDRQGVGGDLGGYSPWPLALTFDRDNYRENARAALEAAAPALMAMAWDEGNNTGAADSAVIIGWGVRGAPPASRPHRTPNPYKATA